jgi:hypothetical protein
MLVSSVLDAFRVEVRRVFDLLKCLDATPFLALVDLVDAVDFLLFAIMLVLKKGSSREE